MNKKHVENQKLLARYKYFAIFTDQSVREASKKLEGRKGEQTYPKLWIRKGKKSLLNVLDVTIAWMKRDSCPLLYLDFSSNATETEFSLILDRLEEIKSVVKLKIFLPVVKETDLKFLQRVYENDFDVFDLELSFGKQLKGRLLKSFRELKKIVHLKDITTDGRIYYRGFENSSLLKDFVQSCPSKKSFLKIDGTHGIPDEFLKHIRQFTLEIAITTDSFEFYPNQRRFILRSKRINHIEDILMSLKHPKELQILLIDRFGIEPSLDVVARVIEHFPNLHEVTIGKKPLKEMGPKGKRLHEDFLAKGMSKHLKKLIENKAKSKYNRGKIMVLGQGGAGKTATLRSLSGQKFNKKHIKTIVANKLNIVDTDGDDFKQIGENNDGFAVDLAFVTSGLLNEYNESTDFQAPGEVEIRKRNLRHESPNEVLKRGLIFQRQGSQVANFGIKKKFFGRKVNQLLPGCLKDMDPNNIFEEKERNVYLSNLANLKNKIKHSWWDFGGQRVFDALHPLYLTSEGIYLLVFSLKRLIKHKEDTLSYMRWWLSSLSLYSQKGTVFLVGTRVEDKHVVDKIDEANEAIKDLQADFDLLNFVYNNDKKLRFFPVENSLKNNHYLKPLKLKLKEITQDTTIDSTWNRDVELSWMFFMHQVYSTDANAICFESFEKEASGAGFTSKEAKDMINFFASAGEILDFRHLIQDSTKQAIVMKPRWLLKVLGTIITCREDCTLQAILEEIAAGCSEGCKALLVLLNKYGVVSSLLLYKFLKVVHNVSDKEFELITTIGEKMFVMARFGELPELLNLKQHHLKNNAKFWVIPSFFVKEPTETETKALFVNKKDVSCKEPLFRKEISWSKQAPMGLFEKFLCSLINAGRDLEGKSFKVAQLKGRKMSFILEHEIFEIQFESSCCYHLNGFCNNRNIISRVCQILKVAYKAVYSLTTLHSVANQACEFYSEIEFSSNLFGKTEKWDVFLSHCWKNGTHDKVLDIYKKMEKAGIKPWIDTYDIGGDINLGMLDGVRNSSAFVAFITKDYLEASKNRNSNAGKEFNFAAAMGVDNIIPVVLDPDLLDPTTWNDSLVKLHLPGALYIDFSTEKKIDTNMEDFLKRVYLIQQTNQ